MSVASGLSGVSGVGSSSESVGITPRYSRAPRTGGPEASAPIVASKPRYSPYCSPQSARRRLGPGLAVPRPGSKRLRSPTATARAGASARPATGRSPQRLNGPRRSPTRSGSGPARRHQPRTPPGRPSCTRPTGRWSRGVSDTPKASARAGSGPEKPSARSTRSHGRSNSVPSNGSNRGRPSTTDIDTSHARSART